MTLFTLLLAAFRVLLARYGGQDDVLISSPVTLRDDAETRRMVGCLVNNVVFRTSAGGDPSFAELLARERATLLGVLEHREVPFGRVIEALDPERHPGEQPLSQIMFQFDVAPAARVAADVTFGVVPVEADRQSYWDLEWSLTDHGDRAAGWRDTSATRPAVFEDWLIEAMPRHFATLLGGIADDPRRRISELPAARRRRTAPRVAGVECDGSAITRRMRPCTRSSSGNAGARPKRWPCSQTRAPSPMRDLERRVAALAARLAAHGAAPGERVALSLRPSAGLVVGLLAILRTGAAFVPLDPAYPRGRREFMLRDCGARLLVTEPGAGGRPACARRDAH